MDYETWYAGELEELQKRLGYRFNDVKKLKTALVHSSFANEKGAKDHNERMEFLGDAVLELGVSHFLFDSFPHFTEGGLTRARASIVRGVSLAEWGLELGLGRLLRTGNSLESDLTLHESLCADGVEAILGAVFLDGGFSSAMTVIEGYLSFHLSRHPVDKGERDPKSALQILAHSRDMAPPLYETLEVSGPPHSPWFLVRVLLGEKEEGRGEGKSKKAAEFAAAEEAFCSLKWIEGGEK